MSIKRHTTYNILGAALPLLLSLVTVPTYLNLVGEARYGVMAIAWLLLGYFGAFDLGLGRATAQRIAAIGDDQPEKTANTFWTALALNGSLGIIGGIVIWPVAAYLFENVFNIGPDLRAELSRAIPWLILAVPVVTLSGVLTGALQGRAQFIELNIVSVTGAAFVQISPLIVAWLHGPDLAWLLPAVVLSRLVTLSLLFTRCRVHVFAGFKPKVSGVLATKLLWFGGWITVSAIISPMMAALDKFFIGATLGAKAVAIYTIPYQLAERSTIVAGSLASALFPRFAIATEAERKKLAEDATRSLAVIMTPIMIAGILLIEPFLSVWISPNFSERAALPAQILLLGYWFNGFARIPHAQLQAANKPHITAILHVFELIPYLLALYYGLQNFGLVGAAFAFSLRTFVDTILLLWFAKTLQKTVSIILIPILLLLCGFLGTLLLLDQFVLWLPSAVLLMLCSLTWSWINVSPQIRGLFFRPIQRLLLKGPDHE